MADAIAKVKSAMELLEKSKSDTASPVVEMKPPVTPTVATTKEAPSVALAKFVQTLRQQLEQSKQQQEQMLQQIEIIKMNIKKFEGALETCEVVSKFM